MGAEFLRGAEELVNVILAVSGVNEARGVAQQRCGGAHVFEPAHTFLGLDRHSGLIHLPLERKEALEIGARPEPRRCQSKWQSLERDRETGMHQHAAQLVLAPAPVLIFPNVDMLGEADGLWARPLIDELRGVL